MFLECWLRLLLLLQFFWFFFIWLLVTDCWFFELLLAFCVWYFVTDFVSNREELVRYSINYWEFEPIFLENIWQELQMRNLYYDSATLDSSLLHRHEFSEVLNCYSSVIDTDIKKQRWPLTKCSRIAKYLNKQSKRFYSNLSSKEVTDWMIRSRYAKLFLKG